MHLRAYNYCATRSSWYYGMYKNLYTCRYSIVNTMLLRVCVAIDWHTDKKWHIFMAIRGIGNVETLFSNAMQIRDPWKLLPPPPPNFPIRVTSLNPYYFDAKIDPSYWIWWVCFQEIFLKFFINSWTSGMNWNIFSKLSLKKGRLLY